MNNEDIKSRLIDCFKDENVKFLTYIDVYKIKQISAQIFDPSVKTFDPIMLTMFPSENKITFRLTNNDNSKLFAEDTYDSELGIEYAQWFKPILRNIVNDKYSLEGEVVSDELIGLEYCQIRDDGVLPFKNLSEMIDFTI